MNTTIIIPNYNGEELLAKNLPSVLDSKKYTKNKISEIIIVDDGSTDNSVKFLKENYGRQVRVIIHKINRGFAASINTGVRMAKTELVCLLNSDVIPQKDFLERMDENFKDEKVFGVSLHEKGFGYAKGKFKNGFIVHEGMPELKTIQESFWANGGSSVLRRSIFMELKGMDEELLSPFYWEDVDLSYRAQKRGFKVLWDPYSHVIHQHEATMKKLNQKNLQRIRERNYLLFNWKNITSNTLMRKHVIALLKKIISHPGYLRIVFMAKKRYGKMMDLRKREIKETIVSDEALFAKFN
jgi:O-antigen biosynthesis protein